MLQPAALRLDDLLPAASGALQGTLVLGGTRNQPDITANLDGNGIAWNDWRAERLHARGRLPWRGSGGALTVDASTAWWTLALYVGIQQFEGNVLTPLVQRRAVSLPPALTLFALLALALLLGPLGLLLAAPLTVVAYALVRTLWVHGALARHQPQAADHSKPSANISGTGETAAASTEPESQDPPVPT